MMDSDNETLEVEDLSITQDVPDKTAHNNSIPYQALQGDEIRILILEPGELGTKLHGRLIHVSLQAARKKYAACSYVWGQQNTDRVQLRVEYGDVHNTTVGHNLGQFLHNIRRPAGESLALWADALCINQDDNAEKSRQVARMVDIYKECQAVFAWLGSANESTQRLLRGILNLSKSIQGVVASSDFFPALMDRGVLQRYLLQRWQSIWDPQGLTLVEKLAIHVKQEWMKDPDPGDAHYMLLLNVLIDDSGLFYKDVDESDQPITMLKGIHSICGMEWWNRMWTAQEFILAPDAYFVLGRAFIPQQQLLSVFQLCEAATDFIGMHRAHTVHLPWLEEAYMANVGGYPNFWTVNQFCRLRTVLKDAAKEDSIIDPLLILAFLNNVPVKNRSGWHIKGATDPRDRIYALLGMVADDQSSIVPDYTKTTEEVYTEFSESFLSQGHLPLLWILHPTQNKFSLPSWCVDWSAIAPKTHFSALITQEHMGKRCDITPSFTTHPLGRAMTIQAHALGRIARMYPATSSYRAHPNCQGRPSEDNQKNPDDHFSNCTGLFDLYEAIKSRATSEENALYELLRFASEPRADRTPTPGIEPHTATTYCFGLLRSLSMRADLSLFDSSLVKSLSGIADSFERIPERNCTALTAEGHVGCAMEEARCGDMLVAVGEYKAPLIVREVEGDEGYWRIIGCGWFPSSRDSLDRDGAVLLREFRIV
ncbi:unnamed protein product [Periconia digitata]|uniref:Heterokaryon incompatibility domain-containing protein n=1 Tax=Periconia digitata TaxID=1303443 RepID=A0A9W4U813_9PLEO|nr:unnamed protein product [Periconia digitata]